MKKNKRFYLVFLSIFILNTSVLADTLKIGIIMLTTNGSEYQKAAVQMAISKHNREEHKIKIDMPTLKIISDCSKATEIVNELMELNIQVIIGIGIEFTNDNGCLSEMEHIIDKNKILYLISVSDTYNKPQVSSNWVNFFTPEMSSDLEQNFISEYKIAYNKEADQITIQSYKSTKVLINAAKKSGDLSSENLKRKFIEITDKKKSSVNIELCNTIKATNDIYEVHVPYAGIRKHPLSNAEILLVLQQGDEVIESEEENSVSDDKSWIRVKRYNNLTGEDEYGWIYKLLIKKVNN